jgi:hypothetical protein
MARGRGFNQTLCNVFTLDCSTSPYDQEKDGREDRCPRSLRRSYTIDNGNEESNDTGSATVTQYTIVLIGKKMVGKASIAIESKSHNTQSTYRYSNVSTCRKGIKLRMTVVTGPKHLTPFSLRHKINGKKNLPQ